MMPCLALEDFMNEDLRSRSKYYGIPSTDLMPHVTHHQIPSVRHVNRGPMVVSILMPWDPG